MPTYYTPYACRPDEEPQWWYGEPRMDYMAGMYPQQMFSYTSEPRPATEKGTGRIKFKEPEENKVKYKIVLEGILLGQDSRTTLMIKNIPLQSRESVGHGIATYAGIDDRHVAAR